jgi:aryl-alcohol dehydrogenase-like predicted oxidoreductase
MRTRYLGTSLIGPSLLVSEQGLGCMGMTHSYGAADETESQSTIQLALDRGITFFDTADIYGPRTGEELLGAALANMRDEVVIATKFGHEITAAGDLRINGHPDYVRAACDASLTRLKTDRIDLFYQHRVDLTVPIEETWGAMHGLVEAGKVRHLGICEAAATTIRRAHSIHPVTAIQSEYSLWTRDVEGNGVLDIARELGIGFVPFSPMGRGMLSGAITHLDELAEADHRRGNPRFQGSNLAENLALVHRLAVIASNLGILPAQLALAWVMAQGSDIVPIPGTTRTAHLAQNIAAGDVVLSPDDMAAIEAIFPPGAASGPRYRDMTNIHV